MDSPSGAASTDALYHATAARNKFLVSTKYKIYPMCILLTAKIGSIRGAGKPFKAMAQPQYRGTDVDDQPHKLNTFHLSTSIRLQKNCSIQTHFRLFPCF